MRWFRSLHWTLTRDYALVTTVTGLLLLLLFMGSLGMLIFNTDAIPVGLVEAVARHSEDLRPGLLHQDLRELQRVFTEWARQGNWQVVNGTGIQYAFDVSDPADGLALVLDAQGHELTRNQTQSTLAAPAGETQVITAALAGSRVPNQLYASNSRIIMAAAPIFDNNGQVAGILVVRTPAFPLSGMLFTLVSLASSFLPAMCFILPAGLAVGLVFGWLTARGLSRRLDRISLAAESWSTGDFTSTIQEARPDEVGRLAQRLNQMARDLKTVVTLKQEMAMLEERNRLALDLHDSVKQQAFAASGQLGAARAWLDRDPQRAAAHLQDTELLLDGLRQELAALILELRPPALAGRDLPTALRDFVGEWSRQTGIETRFHVDGGELRPLPAPVEQALLRVTQEALANSLRHSQATLVNVTLTLGNPLGLSIIDNGQGFETRSVPAGTGLASMRERIQAIGGTLEIASAPHSGTRLTFTLPLQEPSS